MKTWWAGDTRVEKYMGPVSEAIDRHITDKAAGTDIYNRAYEAVYNAIKDQERDSKLSVIMRPTHTIAD